MTVREYGAENGMDRIWRAIVAAAPSANGEFSALDGGREQRSWVGLEADCVVESDSLSDLAEIDASWRSEPEKIWIGWLSYDLGGAALRGETPLPGRFPGLCMRRYSRGLEIDPGGGRISGRVHGGAKGSASEVLDEAAVLRFLGDAGVRRAARSDWPLTSLVAGLTPEDYRAKVQTARRLITAGESYQVNLSQGFHASWCANVSAPDLGVELAERAAQIYGTVREACPADMGALMRVSEGAWFLSNSPETLIDVRRDRMGERLNDVARSWPIKGTRPRREDPRADQAEQNALVNSEKDHAEHVMIVDLVRNDLGRLAQPGSVKAPKVPSLVSLPTVHHLISEVSCRLRPGWTLLEIVEAMFPGGSITGAPKRRTTEIIRELEGQPREIYCGAMILLEPGGFRVNIPIRTAILDREGLSLRSGGGVVIDSDPEAERLETLAKARAFNPKY